MTKSASGAISIRQLDPAHLDHVSLVCHAFSVEGNRITGIRTYRNDAGILSG